MRVITVDQREIQKLGGEVSKYPVSYVIHYILRKHGLFDNILDVTYGVGRFYAYQKPPFLVAADPKVWDWVTTPDVFIPKPVWQLKPILEKMNIDFSVLVCDPPAWEKGVNYNRRDLYSFVIGGANLIIEKSFELAKDLNIKYLLLHFNKLLNERKAIEDIRFTYVARYLNNPELRTTHFTLYEI